MVEGGEGRGGGKARRVEGADGALAVGGLDWGPGWELAVGGHLGQGHNV